jgi:hypothetical protein
MPIYAYLRLFTPIYAYLRLFMPIAVFFNIIEVYIDKKGRKGYNINMIDGGVFYARYLFNHTGLTE